MLTGNKIDLISGKGKFKPQEAERFAEENRLIYLEASAKTGNGIRDAYKEFIVTIVKSHKLIL